jgi:hypothetical protein
MSLSYTDKTAVQNYTLTTIATSFDTQLNSWIAGMSRFADRYCGCTLVSETPSTRKYDGNGYAELTIDRAISITAVTVDDVAVTPLQYPANGNVKNELVLENNCFTVGRQNVEVTGIFALFDEVPDDIKLAVSILVAGVVNAQDDAVKSEKVGDYAVAYNTPEEQKMFKQAMAILDSYRALTF